MYTRMQSQGSRRRNLNMDVYIKTGDLMLERNLRMVQGQSTYLKRREERTMPLQLHQARKERTKGRSRSWRTFLSTARSKTRTKKLSHSVRKINHYMLQHTVPKWTSRPSTSSEFMQEWRALCKRKRYTQSQRYMRICNLQCARH